MPTRAIVILPHLPNLALIQTFRQRYDPLAAYIPPHLTLVFPFNSDLTTAQLESHVQSVAATLVPFPITLQGITGHADEYLFLKVKQGSDELIALHDKLYTSILQPYLSRAHTFTPHLTVGRCPAPAQFRAALTAAQSLTESFTTTVDTLTTYQLSPTERFVEFTTAL